MRLEGDQCCSTNKDSQINHYKTQYKSLNACVGKNQPPEQFSSNIYKKISIKIHFRKCVCQHRWQEDRYISNHDNHLFSIKYESNHCQTYYLIQAVTYSSSNFINCLIIIPPACSTITRQESSALNVAKLPLAPVIACTQS